MALFGSPLFQVNDKLNDGELVRLLSQAGFEQPQAARRVLQRLGMADSSQKTAAALLPYLLTAFSESSDPDRILVSLARFIETSPDRSALFASLNENPRAVDMLVKLFAGSQYLSEILLRDPAYFTRLLGETRLAAKKTPEQYTQEAWSALEAESSYEACLDAVRRYQRFELLRIGACDLLDYYDMPNATRQLSHLAIGIIRTCLRLVCHTYHLEETDFVVIGMGKLGGKELNYSSDIDLLFLSISDESGNSQHTGERLVDALTRVSQEGFLYRVDMRLRPWGQVGPLVSSPKAFMRYLSQHARLWEKQALLKSRVIAGNRPSGNEFLRSAKQIIFDMPVEVVRSQVFAMKQLTESYLRQNNRGWGEVKLGEGSIRDIEFTTQFLQLVHGSAATDILHRNTLKALAKLHYHQYLSIADYRILVDGYIFLRTVEHHLQLMHYRQTHRLPTEPSAIRLLAKRLGFGGAEAGDQFMAQYQQTCAAIRKIYLVYLGSAEMKPSPDPMPASSDSSWDVRKHLDRMVPSYSEQFTREEIAAHAAMADRLESKHLVEVEAHPLEGDLWQATVVAYDFPGELSLICGLMFAHGLNIVKGDAFTYEPAGEGFTYEPAGERFTNEPAQPTAQTRVNNARKKIVDVFTVSPAGEEPIREDLWLRYSAELADFLEMVRAGKTREAQLALAKRVANRLQIFSGDHLEQSVPTLYPIEIEIDNEMSDAYTVLHIEAPDTVGFLYELTTALAFNRIYIARVIVDSIGSRVHDILYVSDSSARKVLDPEGQRKLRAATVLIKHFTHLLPHTPNPESALLHFREFVSGWFEKPGWLDELASLESPEVLHAMARLLGVSDFLWDDFLRMQHENLFPIVQDVDALRSAKSPSQLQEELEALLKPVHDGPQTPVEDAPWQEALNAFKDREMFRVDMRHILGHTVEFWDFSVELTDLVEVVVNAAFHLCHEDLRLVYGFPCIETGEPSEMVVCALGKCGGREMGFASDIELMFIYSGAGKTSGPNVISTSEFYEKLVSAFVSAIHARREGIFEIDLQLRPYGKAGSLSISLDSFKRYFQPGGPAWAYERQALVKLRPVAGNLNLGEDILRLRDAYVYTADPFDVTSMRAMRERQIRNLVTGGTSHPKFSPGGLTDVEYLMQALQINHGGNIPAICLPNTRDAMAALAEHGILAGEDYIRLRKAHTFLRWLIDSLRVVRGNAKDITLPAEDSEEFAYLTRRMNYGSDTHRLRSELLRYTSDVLEINTRLLG